MSQLQRLCFVPVFLVLLGPPACLDRPHRQAVTATVLAEGANTLLTQLGDLYSSAIVTGARAAAASADAASDAEGVVDPSRAARHDAAITKGKAEVVARWSPIWGTDTTPGAWTRLQAAHDAWATRLEAGQEVPDEVADPAVQSAFCSLVLVLPATAAQSIHLPEGLLCP